MIGAFREKVGEGRGEVSATRIITITMALCVDVGLVVAGARDHFHEIGWPIAALAIALNFAVPVQGWLRTKSGHDSLAQAVDFIAARLGTKGKDKGEAK